MMPFDEHLGEKSRRTAALWIFMSVTAILMFFEVALSGVGT
jgi:hypothetical protein